MNILLIEDEVLAAKRTSSYIEQYGQGMHQCGWVQSVADAKAWLNAHGDPDLIISDIELLDGNVFGLFDSYQVGCPVVFATAYDQFLLRAFEANGVGYLLKPYTFEQFGAAMDKVRGLLKPASDPKPPSGALTAQAISALQAALATNYAPSYRERLTIKRSSGITILPLSEVPLLLSEDKVVFAVDATGKRHPLSQTLTSIEKELDPAKWFRVNRGELVHLDYVARLEAYGRDRLAIHLRGIKEAPVTSRDRTPAFRKWVDG